uniref:Uncharacterized protein n=1 Tax=Rhizophora mucronata TaxID=61149 RepID=A0A2P2JTI0_RHIMU
MPRNIFLAGAGPNEGKSSHEVLTGFKNSLKVDVETLSALERDVGRMHVKEEISAFVGLILHTCFRRITCQLVTWMLWWKHLSEMMQSLPLMSWLLLHWKVKTTRLMEIVACFQLYSSILK